MEVEAENEYTHDRPSVAGGPFSIQILKIRTKLNIIYVQAYARQGHSSIVVNITLNLGNAICLCVKVRAAVTFSNAGPDSPATHTLCRWKFLAMGLFVWITEQ